MKEKQNNMQMHGLLETSKAKRKEVKRKVLSDEEEDLASEAPKEAKKNSKSSVAHQDLFNPLSPKWTIFFYFFQLFF